MAAPAKEGTPLVGGAESAHKRKRVLGLLLAVLSAVIASIDPLLTRFVRLNTDTDAAVIAWKYLAVGSLLIAFVHLTAEETTVALVRRLHASRAYLHVSRAALLMALHNLLWTLAVLETSIGHAIAIAALAPLWSVLIEWRLFGDKVSSCTVLSVILTTSAVAMLFLNDPDGPIPGGQGKHAAAALVGHEAAAHASNVRLSATATGGPGPAAFDEGTSRPPSLRGDFYALLSGFCMAAYLGACRWTDQRSPDAPMALGPALGSFLVCAGSGLWAICVRPAYPSTTAWLPILAISFCLGFLEAIATRPVAPVVGAANRSRTP